MTVILHEVLGSVLEMKAGLYFTRLLLWLTVKGGDSVTQDIDLRPLVAVMDGAGPEFKLTLV